MEHDRLSQMSSSRTRNPNRRGTAEEIMPLLGKEHKKMIKSKWRSLKTSRARLHFVVELNTRLAEDMEPSPKLTTTGVDALRKMLD